MLQRSVLLRGIPLALVLSSLPALAAQGSAPAGGTIASPSVSATASAPSSAGATGSVSSAAAAGTIASPSLTTGQGTTVSVPGTETAQFLSAQEKKTLMSEYNRAQSNEEKALRHVSRSQMRELTAAQGARSRTWNEQEKRARRDFFAAHTSGPERRKYVQDYIQRKKEFDRSIKAEYDTARKDWASKLEQMKARQKDQRKKFKAALDQGRRPSMDLWPK